MKVEMVMPQMGESIAEGTVLKWLKGVGDSVEKDENILEISTDKVDSEIPSPAAGTIAELKAAEGDVVPVGSVVAILETEAGAVASVSPPAEKAAAAPAAAPAAATPAPASLPTPPVSTPAAPAAVAAPVPASAGSGSIPRQSGGRFYSPLIRSMAREEGVQTHELDSIAGSGRGGRVTKNDFLNYLQSRGAAGAPVAAPGSAPAAGLAPQPIQTLPVFAAPAPSGGSAKVVPYPEFQVDETRTTGDGRIDVVNMDRMRTMIADHMVRSKATSPHVASVTEVDMTNLVRYREATKKSFQKEHGFKLTYTPIILQAAVQALLDYPMMNSTIENGQLLIKRFIHMGLAVALDSGLIVPVVKNSEEKNFLGIARSVDDLAKRARDKKLKPDEVAGGTFTVTNMGSFGNLFGIPIINQPQSGILGVGAIVKRPMVVGEGIAVRDIMYLSLSYDHRHVDGKLGGLFIQRVRHHLETFDVSTI